MVFYSSMQAPGKHTPRERYIPASRGHTCSSEHISLPPASGYEDAVIKDNQRFPTPLTRAEAEGLFQSRDVERSEMSLS